MVSTVERSVIITGSGSGIGAAIATRIAAPGIGLVLHTRKNADGLAAVAAEVTGRGSTVVTVLGDLAEPSAAPALVATAREQFGRVDQIVANAGKAQRARFGSFTIDDLETALAIMPVSFARLVDAALPDLETSGCGRVVAISSFVAHAYGTADLLFAPTAAAKAALEALAKTLAYQLAPTGITVNCVAPGFTRKTAGGHSAAPAGETKSPGIAATPVGHIAEPTDIAAAVAFLLSGEAQHITGQTLHVDGGLLLP